METDDLGAETVEERTHLAVAEGAAGALPNITTLNGIKRRAVHRANRPAPSVWPLTGVSYNETR